MLTLKVLNKDGEVLSLEKGKDISLNFNAAYNEGDRIRLESTMDTFVAVKFDKTLSESIIFIPGKSFEFQFPLKRYVQAAMEKKRSVVKAIQSVPVK